MRNQIAETDLYVDMEKLAEMSAKENKSAQRILDERLNPDLHVWGIYYESILQKSEYFSKICEVIKSGFLTFRYSASHIYRLALDIAHHAQRIITKSENFYGMNQSELTEFSWVLHEKIFALLTEKEKRLTELSDIFLLLGKVLDNKQT